MKKKRKVKKSELKAHTKWFHELLKRAAQPLSELEAQTKERKTSGENISKRTHQHKAEDADD
jgi:hypothetical protein